MMDKIDLSWLAANPLPELRASADKNERGRVLIVGGASFVPGAALLAGEAALRVGAGKLRIATTEKAAIALGIAMPEAAIFALPADEAGEIDIAAADTLSAASARCDAIVLGPGMVDEEKGAALLSHLLDRTRESMTLVVDAACIGAVMKLKHILRLHEDRVVLTPHFGEMARLLDKSVADIETDSGRIACATAEDIGVTIVLKSDQTLVASPDVQPCLYVNDCPGLATSGSGDVLAGVIGGLLARGASPHQAACWGAWLHGEAGRILSGRIGRAGFLARELLMEIPRLANLDCTASGEEAQALHRRTS